MVQATSTPSIIWHTRNFSCHDDDVDAALTAVPSQHCGCVDICLLSSIMHMEFMVSLMSWLRASIAKVGRHCHRYRQIERHQSDPREDHHISQQVHPSCLKLFLPNTGDGGLLFAQGVKVEYVIRCWRPQSEKWIWTCEEMVINDPRPTFIWIF